MDSLLEEQPLIVSGFKIILNEQSLKVCLAYNWSDTIIIIIVHGTSRVGNCKLGQQFSFIYEEVTVYKALTFSEHLKCWPVQLN